eukprot:TRINITY_DN4032_c0_g1_i2.p1 TRINITY_DN4032_c0_g1~~TRINITY_DN4032_c0_g1_i2.p1  ORF type:complete len:157 (+),score=16.49 TRINITY_DN4032_c0_g1_i2:340-810(+)
MTHLAPPLLPSAHRARPSLDHRHGNRNATTVPSAPPVVNAAATPDAHESRDVWAFAAAAFGAALVAGGGNGERMQVCSAQQWRRSKCSRGRPATTAAVAMAVRSGAVERRWSRRWLCCKRRWRWCFGWRPAPTTAAAGGADGGDGMSGHRRRCLWR